MACMEQLQVIWAHTRLTTGWFTLLFTLGPVSLLQRPLTWTSLEVNIVYHLFMAYGSGLYNDYCDRVFNIHCITANTSQELIYGLHYSWEGQKYMTFWSFALVMKYRNFNIRVVNVGFGISVFFPKKCKNRKSYKLAPLSGVLTGNPCVGPSCDCELVNSCFKESVWIVGQEAGARNA